MKWPFWPSGALGFRGLSERFRPFIFEAVMQEATLLRRNCPMHDRPFGLFYLVPLQAPVLAGSSRCRFSDFY